MQSEERIFIDAEVFFERIKLGIDRAQKSIRFQMYIFELNHLGKSILQHLAKASKRGVKVDLLIDGVGSSSWTFNDILHWRSQGIFLNVFHPLPWQRHSFQVWKWLRLQKITAALFRMNHRNHRKMCNIDNQDIFLGSANVANVHLKSVKGRAAWRDTSIQVRAEDHPDLLNLYPEALKLSRHHYGKIWKIVRQHKKEAQLQLIQRIRNSKQRVWITNPYFVPNFKLIRALCSAARAGKEVKILVPKRIDVVGIKFAIEAFYHLLLTFKVEIYEYLPSMLHAKILICDDWISIGSSNLDYRSILYNLEADVIVQNENNIRLVEEQFREDLKVSYQIDHEVWKKRSFFSRFFEKAFLRFREHL